MIGSAAIATDNYGLIESKPNGAAFTQNGDVTFGATNGPFIENAASSTTNPTLVPDKASPTAGVGGTSGDVDIITAGVSRINVDTAGAVTNATSTTFNANVVLISNSEANFGTGSLANIAYRTEQTPDSWIFAVPPASNALLIMESADRTTDMGHAQQTNPTVYLHSADATNTAQWVSLVHNQTNAVVSTGAGDLSVTPAGLDVLVTGRISSVPTTLISLDAATAIAITRNFHNVDCVGAETITTATGGTAGMILTLLFNTDSDVCTLTDTAAATADTFNLSAAFASTTGDTITFIHDGTKWYEIGRAVN